MPPAASNQTGLFIVYVDGAKNADLADICEEAMQLDGALVLVRTTESQSRLYHRVKRHAQPSSLFVARLDGRPKFKGMAEGATKWTRELEGVSAGK